MLRPLSHLRPMRVRAATRLFAAAGAPGLSAANQASSQAPPRAATLLFELAQDKALAVRPYIPASGARAMHQLQIVFNTDRKIQARYVLSAFGVAELIHGLRLGEWSTQKNLAPGANPGWGIGVTQAIVQRLTVRPAAAGQVELELLDESPSREPVKVTVNLSAAQAVALSSFLGSQLPRLVRWDHALETV